jgi:hypothetical protein
MGDDPGFAASRPGQDQQRTFQVLHGLALRRGKSFEKMIHGNYTTQD